jgi:hypothetical protein
MAFHEKAGRCQGPIFLSQPSFLVESIQSGPEQSRARFVRRQRTLDGEDRSATIPRGRKGAVRLDFGLSCHSCFAPKPTLSPPFHPHSRWSDFSLGASWAFSFQPVLPPDYRPPVPFAEWKLGQAINAVTGTRRLGLRFSFPGMFFKLLPASPSGRCSAMVRTLLRLPTNDVARPQVYEPPQ